jgi:hypothetical protein
VLFSVIAAEETRLLAGIQVVSGGEDQTAASRLLKNTDFRMALIII